MQLTPISTNSALAEQRIVCRHFLHLGDDRLAIGSALQRRNGFEVMKRAGIDAGLIHRRILAGRIAFGVPTLSPGASSVIKIPIECFGQTRPCAVCRPSALTSVAN